MLKQVNCAFAYLHLTELSRYDRREVATKGLPRDDKTTCKRDYFPPAGQE